MLSHQQDIKNPNLIPYQLPAKKRLDFIINHEAPLALVRSMPTSDLLMTIRELGGESSLELVEMMHPEQVQELFDLEIWQSDKLNLHVAGHYFSLLFAANPDTAIAQLHGLDIELIGLLLKNVATIYDTSLGEEPIDFPELYSTSPDQRFIVCFSDEKECAALAQSLYQFIEELYGRDLSFVLRLLESLRYEVPSDLEEESLRWRQNRLLDMGILPREERLVFFSTLSPTDIKRKASLKPLLPLERPAIMSVRHQSVRDEHVFLRSALQNLPAATTELFWHGFIHIVTNMHASLSEDFGDQKEILKTSDYVAFLLEAGLAQLCQGNAVVAGDILSSTSPTYIVRAGRTALVALRKRLLIKVTEGQALFGKNYIHADSPLREVAQALSLPEPRFFEGLLDEKNLNVRFFSTLIELNATILAIHELIFRAELLGSLKDDIKLDEGSTKQHAGLFAHLLINRFLQKQKTSPLRPDEINSLFVNNALTSEFTQFARVLAHDLSEHYATISKRSQPEAEERIQAFVTAILIQLEQNWSLLLG